MRSPKTLVIFIALVFVVIVAGYAIYSLVFLPNQVEAAPSLQKAAVRTGDIVILVTASGNVLLESEVPLGFRIGGVLADLRVSVGTRVEAGEVLARLDDTAARVLYEQAKLEWDALLSPSAVLEAELAALNAEDASEEAEYRLDAVESRVDTDQPPTQEELDFARITADLAECKSAESRAYAALVSQAEITDIDIAEAEGVVFDRLKRARLALINAQYALDGMSITAPFAGLVTKVDASEGQNIGTSPILAVASMDKPVLRFLVDEADMSKVKAGNRITASLDGYNNIAFEGIVTSLEPSMGMVDGSPVLVGWASLTPDPNAPIFSGMTAELQIYAGESYQTLLVPAAALRELSSGSYAVFVVQSDERLLLTPVTVGLQDLTYAEILEGLQAGDFVSTGSIAAE